MCLLFYFLITASICANISQVKVNERLGEHIEDIYEINDRLNERLVEAEGEVWCVELSYCNLELDYFHNFISFLLVDLLADIKHG